MLLERCASLNTTWQNASKALDALAMRLFTSTTFSAIHEPNENGDF